MALSLEELAGLGKVSRDVEPLSGIKVRMHTLTAGEEQKVNEFIASFPNDLMARSKVLQIETLVHSIESINGKVFSDTKELRAFLSNLQGFVLDHLYSAYINIEKESAETIDKLKKDLEPSKVG